MSDHGGWQASWSPESPEPAQPPGAPIPLQARLAAAEGQGEDRELDDIITANRPAAPPTLPPATPAGERPATPTGSADRKPAAAARTATVPLSELDSRELLRQRKDPPVAGWRRTVYKLSRGAINPGPSHKDIEFRQLLDRVRAPVAGCQRIAVISLKGGVGKTTTAAGLGATLASVRGDRVIAVDANPDMGTLAGRFARETHSTVRDLLTAQDSIRSYADVRRHTSQGPSRLEVLASDQDPAVSQAFGEPDYRAVSEVLSRYYNIIITDSGTGLLHSAMSGILALADSLIVVSSPSVDGARSADATLSWLTAHNYDQLVSRSVAVLSTVRPGAGDVDVDRLEQHFASRCRAVVRIPYDEHLGTGAEIDLDRLSGKSRAAYLSFAAVVADGFAASAPPRGQSAMPPS